MSAVNRRSLFESWTSLMRRIHAQTICLADKICARGVLRGQSLGLVLLGCACGGLRSLAAEGSSAVSETRRELIGQVDAAWAVPPAAESATAPVESDALQGAVARKLATIMLPSVSFSGMELGRVLTALGAAAAAADPAPEGRHGVNLVLVNPGGEAAMVTISLQGLTLGKVLDLITESVGFQYEVTADAVILRRADELPPLRTARFPLTRAALVRLTGAVPDAAGPAPLRRGGAAETGPAALEAERSAIETFLQRAGVDFLGIAGSGLAYDGAGIFVTQTTRQLERVREILAHLRPVRQVAIEAKFLEVQEGVLRELGVDWNVTRPGLPLLDPVSGGPALDANGRPVFSPVEIYRTAGVTRPLPDAFNGAQSLNAILIDGTPVASTRPSRLPGTVSLGENAGPLAQISTMVGEFDVEAVVRALEQKQGADLLSAPRVTVLSGQPASIIVAQEMRYPQAYTEIKSQVGSTAGGGTGGSGSAGVTITAGTPQDFATRHVGVELRVTPRVEDDGVSITLDLNPRVTDFDGFMEYGGPSLAISAGRSVTVPPGFYQPIFSVRELETKVTLRHGATLVMGGLTREEVKRVEDKVPVLGSIPGLGRLFRSTGQSTQKRSLLIFVTARLVEP
jgi:general secretion pathway protein D